MKSFCIKTNNIQIRDYLLNNLSHIYLEDVYYICRQFKIYQNIIIHYKGSNISDFIFTLTNIITNSILIYYEPSLIKKSIKYNYFYFEEYEQKLIEETCYSHITSSEDSTVLQRKDGIFDSTLQYINENKSIILDGFVNFRLQNYLNIIDEIVDYAVNKYIIEKEYNEFINLLKLYIDSRGPQTELVHLIYSNEESVLLDNNKNLIKLDTDFLESKYLSDISFSSNDYALNTLLTLLPQRIIVHIIGYEDEFISTLKLVFDKRISICIECDICKKYKKILNNIRILNNIKNK